jgi:ubiquinone/menaquinone biosynthesis C-methylase UbiE
LNSDTLLDIGCGTGGVLVAARHKFKDTIGIDISLQRLVIAKKRFEELNLNVSLLCGGAERLPFRNNWFDLIFAGDVIEHVKDQTASLMESRRVLKKDGILFIATPNRFSVTPEPHVRVWGVGFLPRKWTNKYVKLIKGISYTSIKVLSFFELKKLLKKCFFNDYHILLPSVIEAERDDFSCFEKSLVNIYDWGRKIPIIRFVLYCFGPFFHIICRGIKR